MDNSNHHRRGRPRQKWNPHWSLKLLYGLWSAALAAIKIALGAAATVLLIVLICGTVFVGILGNYLQDDILAEAADWSVEDYDLERTSFIYYVDSNGDIQQLLTDNRSLLDEISEFLLVKETITGDELMAFVNADKNPAPAEEPAETAEE